METKRKDVFAEDMRRKNPSLKYWDDDRILTYVNNNFPEVASSIEWIDPPSEPDWMVKSASQWSQMAKKLPQYWESSKTSFANSYRLDPDEGQEMQDFLNEYSTFGGRDVDWQAKKEEYEKKDKIDLTNYLEAKRVADEKIADDPNIQAVRAWYDENPVRGFSEWFSKDNIAYGFNSMASSYLPIAASAYIGSVGGLFIPTGFAAAVGTAYTMEAGNNFETAYATLISEGIPKEKAFQIAKRSAHLYGVASGFLESIAPTRLLSTTKLPRLLRERTARIFQKDILKDTWKKTGKAYTSKEMGKKMTEGAVDFTHKYGIFKNKFGTDGIVGDAVKGIARGIWKAGKAVIYPTQTKIEQMVIEGMTEGAQWLAEEAINDGFVLPENGTPGEWDWGEIVSAQWLQEKVKSDGFKSSVAMGMYTYFLPFGKGGGGSTSLVGGAAMGKPSAPGQTPSEEGRAVNTGRVKILSGETAAPKRDDTTVLPEPVQKWRDLINPNKFDATATDSPKDQMLKHALSSPNNLVALEGDELDDDEKFRIIQQLGEAINTSNLPEDYNITLPAVDGKYNPDDVLGILKKLTVSKSGIVTEQIASGGMDTSTKQRINVSSLNKEELVKMQTRPSDYNMLELSKMSESEVHDKPENQKPQESMGEMVLPILERYRKIHLEKGPEAARSAIIDSKPEQFRNLVKELGKDNVIDAGIFDRRKDGTVSATRKNKEIIYKYVNGLLKQQIIAAEDIDYSGEANKKQDLDNVKPDESSGQQKGGATVQKAPKVDADNTGSRALEEILKELEAGQRLLEKSGNMSPQAVQDLKDKVNTLKSIAEEAGYEGDDPKNPIPNNQMIDAMATLVHIMQSKDRKAELKKIFWEQNDPESVLAALKQMKNSPLATSGVMPTGMIDSAIKLQLELMSEMEVPFPVEYMIEPPVGSYNWESTLDDKQFQKNLKKLSQFKKSDAKSEGVLFKKHDVQGEGGKILPVVGGLVTKRSPLTGKMHTVWIPGYTREAHEAFSKGEYVQNILPHADADLREFLINGIPPGEDVTLDPEANTQMEDIVEQMEEADEKPRKVYTKGVGWHDPEPSEITLEEQKRSDILDSMTEAMHILSAISNDELTFDQVGDVTGINDEVLTAYLDALLSEDMVKKSPGKKTLVNATAKPTYKLTNLGAAELQEIINRYSELRGLDNGFKGVNDDSEPDYSRIDIENKTNQPYVKDAPELANKIAARLDKHFGKIGITGKSVARLFDKHGVEVAGKALKHLALWSEDKARIDDIPHEYVHIYIDLFQDHPLIKAGLKRFQKDFKSFDPEGLHDAKENLAHIIDEYYTGRIQDNGLISRIKAWIRQLWLRFKRHFKSISKEEYGLIIGEKFFQGWIPKVKPRKEGASEIYYSHIDDNESSFEDQTNADGDPEEIDALDNLKSGASDLFLTGIFIKEMGTHISNKFMTVDVYEAAKSAVNFDEFSEWFIETVREQFGGAIREGREELYDKYARQLYQAKNSSTKLYGYYENQENEDDSREMVIVDPDGRIRYEMIFEVENRNAIDHTLGLISKNNRARRGTQNPQSFRQNFVESEREQGNIDARFIELPVKMLINHIHPYDEGLEPFYSDRWVDFSLSRKWIDTFDNMLALQHHNGKKNLHFFFSTKSGDKPSIFFSAVPTAWIGSAQPELAGKPFDVREVDRDFLIKELKAQADAGWLIWNETDGGHAQNLIGDGDKLVGMRSKKVDSGKKNKKGKKIYTYVKAPNNPYAYAQILAYHIRWQQLKGNRYLMREVEGDNVRATVRRLSLDFGEGVTIQGAPDRRIMWAEWEEIDVEMPDEHGNMKRVELKGIRGNKWDGGLYNGGRYLTEMSRLLGRGPTAMMKTHIRHLSSDLNDYYLSKHMEFSPWKGMKIYKKGQSFPIARVVGSSNDSYFMLMDAAGNDIGEFDTFETTTELKDKDGIYNVPWTVHSLPGSSTKAIIIPSSSRDNAPHPVNFHELVLDDILLATPEGKEYTRVLNKFIKNKVNEYMDRLLEFRTDKAALAEYLTKELEEGQLPTEIDKIVRMFPMGEGLSIPQYNRQIVAMLSNRFITNGAFKLRTSHNHGTKLYPKPHDLRIEDGKYAVAADSTPTVNLIIDEYIKSPLSGSATSRSQIGWQNEHEMIADLNSFLIKSDLDFLLHRQPIQGGTKVEPRILQQFVEGFHGDAIFVSNKDLAELHDGDNDGDTLYIEREDPELIKVIGDLSRTERWGEMDKIVKTSMFLGNLSSTTLSSRQDRGKFYEDMSQTDGAQGQAVAAKLVSSTIGHKNINFGLSFLPKGHRMHARKNSDTVVMDFIELDPNMTKEDYDIIAGNNDKVVMFRMNKDTKQKGWATVPWEFKNEKGEMVSGLKTAANAGYKLHLETTHGNQMSNIIMFAVDNPAEGLLGQFAFSWSFLMDLMWYQTIDGGVVEGAKHKSVMRYLSSAYRVFNRGKTRRGRSMNNNSMGMGSLQSESERVRAMYFEENGDQRSPESVNATIRTLLNDSSKTKNGKNIKVHVKGKGKVEAFVTDVQGDANKVTPMERIIAQPDLHFKQDIFADILRDEGKDVMSHPKWHYDWAHVQAMRALEKVKQGQRDNLLKNEELRNEIADAIRMMEFIAAEQTNIFKEAEANIRAWSTETEIETIKYEYSPEFIKMVEKWLPEWNKLNSMQKAWATLHFLAGTSHINLKGDPTKVAFRGILLPLDLMSEAIIKEYGKLFHEALKDKAKFRLMPQESKYEFKFKEFLQEYEDNACG